MSQQQGKDVPLIAAPAEESPAQEKKGALYNRGSGAIR
jgi:hypothetical protein